MLFFQISCHKPILLIEISQKPQGIYNSISPQWTQRSNQPKIKFPFLTNKLQKSNLQTIPYINPKKYDSIRSTTHFIPTQSCQLQNDIIFFQLINDIKLKYNESNTFIIKIYKLCVSFMMFNSVSKHKLAKNCIIFHYFNKKHQITQKVLLVSY